MSEPRCAGCQGPVEEVGQTCSLDCENFAREVAGLASLPPLLTMEQLEQTIERTEEARE